MKLCQSFVPVNKTKHLIKNFDCGKPEMNIFLSRFSVKHAKLGLSKTLVLPHEKTAGNKSLIASYYTLAASTVSSQDLPTTQSLPRHPIPVALLARRLSENAGFCQIKA